MSYQIDEDPVKPLPYPWPELIVINIAFALGVVVGRFFGW